MTELTHLLSKSLQFVAMQKAITEAVPLLQRELTSLSQTITRCTNDGRTSFVTEAMQKQHDELLAVVNQCQAALNPVPVEPEPAPLLICPACDDPTPGLIDGLCLTCDELFNSYMRGIELAPSAVLQMPKRRVQ